MTEIKYKAKIKATNNIGSKGIKVPKEFGNPGDEVEVNLRITRRLVEVE